METKPLKLNITEYIHGDIFEKFYTDSEGVKQGIFSSFYENGKPLEECIYKDGKKHGKYRAFYNDGSICIEGFFKNGKEHGLFKEYPHPQLRNKLNKYGVSYYENGNEVRDELKIKSFIIKERFEQQN